MTSSRGPLIVSVNLTVAARDMLKEAAAIRKMTMASLGEIAIRAELLKSRAMVAPVNGAKK